VVLIHGFRPCPADAREGRLGDTLEARRRPYNRLPDDRIKSRARFLGRVRDRWNR